MLTINVLSKNKENITIFHLKIIIFTAVKYYSILYGRVFVMIIGIIFSRFLKPNIPYFLWTTCNSDCVLNATWELMRCCANRNIHVLLVCKTNHTLRTRPRLSISRHIIS